MHAIRLATVEDAQALARHRTEMWLAMKYLQPHSALEMTNESTQYFREAIATKEYIGWVIETETNDIVAGGGLSLRRTAPSPDQKGLTMPTFYTAHIFNVFVEPEYRKKGLARQIMEFISQWCQQNNIPILTLNASEQGTPLYESIGYTNVKNFMRLKFS